jgi:acyl carrier protein
MIKGTTDEDIFERLKKLIVNQKGIQKVGKMTANTSLRKDLEFDSLGLVDLILACEDEFGIEIPPEDRDLEKVDTIQEAVFYLKKRLDMREQ